MHHRPGTPSHARFANKFLHNWTIAFLWHLWPISQKRWNTPLPPCSSAFEGTTTSLRNRPRPVHGWKNVPCTYWQHCWCGAVPECWKPSRLLWSMCFHLGHTRRDVQRHEQRRSEAIRVRMLQCCAVLQSVSLVESTRVASESGSFYLGTVVHIKNGSLQRNQTECFCSAAPCSAPKHHEYLAVFLSRYVQCVVQVVAG